MKFGHGQFLGNYQSQRELSGLRLADLKPTVPEYDVEIHTHEDAHFLLLINGLYLSSAKNMPAICNEMALVVNPPGTRHRDCFRGLDGRFLTLSMSQHDWQQAGEISPLPEYATRLQTGALLSACRIWREHCAWDSSSALVIESELQYLLADVSLGLQQEKIPAPLWLLRAYELLRDNLHETPRLSELAKACDVHPVYFTRAFGKRFGCSPGEFLRRCRLERATGLLRDNKLSLAQIASLCGFVDQSHFHHLFQRRYRMGPNQFRMHTRH